MHGKMNATEIAANALAVSDCSLDIDVQRSNRYLHLIWADCDTDKFLQIHS